MKGYGQFCPIAVACETFAERWTPLILRELLAGARRFNELRQGMPMISRTLLAQRLRELEEAGIIQSKPLARRRGREYLPTRLAEEFRVVLAHVPAGGALGRPADGGAARPGPRVSELAAAEPLRERRASGARRLIPHHI